MRDPNVPDVRMCFAGDGPEAPVFIRYEDVLLTLEEFTALYMPRADLSEKEARDYFDSLRLRFLSGP